MASKKRNGKARSAGKRKVADAPKERPQQYYDRIAIGLVLLGLVALVSLTVPNSGVVGAALRDGLKLLFGNGAFLLPVVLWVAAGALVFGYGKLALPEVLTGGLIVYLALLGWLAQPSASGDWFAADALRASGGYLGAVLGYTLHLALGQAKGVVLGALGVLGLLMLFNLPLAQVLRGVGRAVWHGWRGASTATKSGRQQPQARSPSVPSARPMSDARASQSAPSSLRARATQRPAAPTQPTPNAPAHPSPIPPTADTRDAPKPALPTPSASGNYTLPPLSLLREPPAPPKRNQAEIKEKIAKLEETLQDFGIDANVVEVAHGPTVTRYEIQLAPGIKVNRVVNLADNLAMALAAIAVRVEAPIPGKSAIGVEVPNDHPHVVALREVMENAEFWNAPSLLTVALGKDVAGAPKYADLSRMPHLLIGGATNSGKSMCLLSLIACLLFRATPRELRFVMIDPKRVELTLFRWHPAPDVSCGARCEVGGGRTARPPQGDGQALRPVRREGRAQHSGLQRARPRRRTPAVCGGHHRRAGRPDDASRVGGGDLHRATGATRPRNGHPPRDCHAAPLRRCHHGHNQGEHRQPNRVRRLQPGGQPHDPGHGRRGAAAGARRYAVFAD
jgi:S-DNA-T family DNA segregation ATPase FtsK/SpoIIIE